MTQEGKSFNLIFIFENRRCVWWSGDCSLLVCEIRVGILKWKEKKKHSILCSSRVFVYYRNYWGKQPSGSGFNLRHWGMFELSIQSSISLVKDLGLFVSNVMVQWFFSKFPNLQPRSLEKLQSWWRTWTSEVTVECFSQETYNTCI